MWLAITWSIGDAVHRCIYASKWWWLFNNICWNKTDQFPQRFNTKLQYGILLTTGQFCFLPWIWPSILLKWSHFASYYHINCFVVTCPNWFWYRLSNSLKFHRERMCNSWIILDSCVIQFVHRSEWKPRTSSTNYFANLQYLFEIPRFDQSFTK